MRRKQCPRCKEHSLYKNGDHDYALSRRDNKKRICSSCGVAEAIEDCVKQL